jgi:superfamily I DNA/RNA helicase
VRYNLIGGQSYFDRREIRDALAYLKMLVNPHDDVNLLRIANIPARGLSDVTMERLLGASHERHCSVFSAMKHTDVLGMFVARTRESIGDFVSLIEDTRAQLKYGNVPSIGGWLEKFLTDIGYIDELRRSEKNIETADNRVRNVKELAAELQAKAPANWSQQATTNSPENDRDDSPFAKPTRPVQADGLEIITDFLSDITLDQEREEEKESTADAVTLITMHSCKGLEYPHVFIVGLEDGLLPHSRSKVEGTLDEERRLFYVAITRAREGLTMSYCLSRKKYGQAMPCHPSGFLKEIPDAYMMRAEEKAKGPMKPAEGKSLFANLRESLG